MARLAANAAGGFFPAALPAVDMVLRLLSTQAADRICIIDPCCGEGEALAHLAKRLKATPKRVYGIELEEGRAAKAIERLPAAKIMQASFFAVNASLNSFGLAWVNPPFDDELGGGGRVESSFLDRATKMLAVGGIMVLICPENVAHSTDIQTALFTHYDDVSITPFPADDRPFNEVAVIGVKREKEGQYWLRKGGYYNTQPVDPTAICENPGRGHYVIPPCMPTRTWLKFERGDAEVLTDLARSPLHKLLHPPAEPPLPSPPLPLGSGHIALTLATGYLDGLVEPPGEPPHVVRGTARKITYVSDVTETESEDGKLSTTTTYSQKIVLVVRAVDQVGEIITLQQSPDLEIVNDSVTHQTAEETADA